MRWFRHRPVAVASGVLVLVGVFVFLASLVGLSVVGVAAPASVLYALIAGAAGSVTYLYVATQVVLSWSGDSRALSAPEGARLGVAGLSGSYTRYGPKSGVMIPWPLGRVNIESQSLRLDAMWGLTKPYVLPREDVAGVILVANPHQFAPTIAFARPDGRLHPVEFSSRRIVDALRKCGWPVPSGDTITIHEFYAAIARPAE